MGEDKGSIVTGDMEVVKVVMSVLGIVGVVNSKNVAIPGRVVAETTTCVTGEEQVVTEFVVVVMPVGHLVPMKSVTSPPLNPLISLLPIIGGWSSQMRNGDPK